jgi:hypothetical protein
MSAIASASTSHRIQISPLWLVPLASACAWGIAFALVPPAQQNFPLMDDWAFGRSAFAFSAGEGIHYYSWASMPQLGQWLWACPFIWVLGPTFFSLRLSTIAMSWIGIASFYELLCQENWPKGRAALAAACLAFHPLFFTLQGTFMTDVPSLSLALAALALYGRALRNRNLGWLAFAAFVAILAGITRQNTVAVPCLAAIQLGRDATLRRQGRWWLAVTIPLVIGLVVHFWFQRRTDIIAVQPRVLPPPSLLLLPYLAIHWGGLTVIPLLALQPFPKSRRMFLATLLVLAANAGYWFYQGQFTSDLDGLFPYTGTMLSPWGIGSGDLHTGERPVVLDDACRILLTAIGCVGGALLAVRASAWEFRTLLSRPLFLFALSQIVFVFIAPALWDRYLLPSVVLGALELMSNDHAAPEPTVSGRWGWAAALGLLAVSAGTSVVLMHDWLADNAAMWELGRRALARGVDPADVEGGMEWNGWHQSADSLPQGRSWRELFAILAIKRKAGPPKGLTLESTRVWFPHVSGRYALSFSPLEGTQIVDSEPYVAWLSPGERRVYLLEWKSAEKE